MLVGVKLRYVRLGLVRSCYVSLSQIISGYIRLLLVRLIQVTSGCQVCNMLWQVIFGLFTLGQDMSCYIRLCQDRRG